MRLQRLGAFLSYNRGYKKMQIWKRSVLPLANDMEDKHCAGKTLYLISNKKRGFDVCAMPKPRAWLQFSPELRFNDMHLICVVLQAIYMIFISNCVQSTCGFSAGILSF